MDIKNYRFDEAYETIYQYSEEGQVWVAVASFSGAKIDWLNDSEEEMVKKVDAYLEQEAKEHREEDQWPF